MRIFDPNRLELLNVGCGRHFHSEWKNIDLEACSDDVQQHNLLEGIPFEDQQFDAVYHSHLLEHLTPTCGQHLIKECFRVLKPGGVLRIVVPDLEQITRLYLESHELAWTGDESAKADYEWMKLELIDQMVRGSSGGLMGRYMTDPTIKNREFVLNRIGGEINNCGPSNSEAGLTKPIQKPNLKKRLSKTTERLRKKLVRTTIRLLLGSEKLAAFEEGLFRNQGEVHRWMYDRYSLKQLCADCGFEDPQVCSAFNSQIENFSSFQLDSSGNAIRKPDSLYLECIKPRTASVQRMAA